MKRRILNISISIFLIIIVFCGLSISARSPINTRYFSSLEELQGWLATQDTDYDTSYCSSTCLNAALALQARANEDGYYMNLQDSDMRFYYRQFPIPEGLSLWMNFSYTYRTHAYNSTIAGGYIYYIEPQTLEVSRAGTRIY